jgi:hypothetical protein
MSQPPSTSTDPSVDAIRRRLRLAEDLVSDIALISPQTKIASAHAVDYLDKVIWIQLSEIATAELDRIADALLSDVTAEQIEGNRYRIGAYAGVMVQLYASPEPTGGAS